MPRLPVEVGPQERASWGDMTCDGDMDGQYLAHVSVGGEAMIEAAVYAVYLAGEAPEAKPELKDVTSRFKDAVTDLALYDEVIAQAAAAYGDAGQDR